MNIPNILTIFRILLVPLLIVFLIEGKMDLALVVFVVAGITDALDGFLARVLHQKTDFGAFIDPVADKLLLVTSYLTLAVLDLLPSWLAVLVVSRDAIIVMGIGILFFNRKSFDIKPTYDSKATTFLQLVTICFVLGRQYLGVLVPLENLLVHVTAAMTVFSGFHYLAIGFKIVGKE